MLDMIKIDLQDEASKTRLIDIRTYVLELVPVVERAGSMFGQNKSLGGCPTEKVSRFVCPFQETTF